MGPLEPTFVTGPSDERVDEESDVRRQAKKGSAGQSAGQSAAAISKHARMRSLPHDHNLCSDLLTVNYPKD
jgi:hypothetical protein